MTSLVWAKAQIIIHRNYVTIYNPGVEKLQTLKIGNGVHKLNPLSLLSLQTFDLREIIYVCPEEKKYTYNKLQLYLQSKALSMV